jgi:hypothetical protein
MNLFCLYHQFRTNNALDDGFEPASETLKHLKSCTCCQTWYQKQRRLIKNLKSRARSKTPIHPPQLLPAVLASIENHSSDFNASAQRTTPMPWQKWLMPVATTCVAITLIIQWTTPSPVEKLSPHTTKWFALSPEGLVQQTTGLSIADWGQQLDNPLEKEWSLLKEEAQATAGGLAGTFLPSKFVAFYQPASSQQP